MAVILDFGGGFFLRHATADDHPALCMMCLKTGAAGQDATEREDDPELMGLVHAVPYQVMEPDFAFVIERRTGVAGYLFGTPDTRLAAEWYPPLQARIRDPGADPARWQGSDWVRRMIHHPQLEIAPALFPFPSHGHIDLLPEARGRGIGTRCMAFLEKRLAAALVKAACCRRLVRVLLDVNSANQKALKFYQSLGYRALSGVGNSNSSQFVAKQLTSA